MRTLRHSVICLMTVWTLAGVTASGSEQPLSNTRSASCIVNITVNPAVMPLSRDTVRSLIYTSHVVGQAIREVLGDPDDLANVEETIEIEWLSQTGYGAGAPALPNADQATPVYYDRPTTRQPEVRYGMTYADMSASAPRGAGRGAIEPQRTALTSPPSEPPSRIENGSDRSDDSRGMMGGGMGGGMIGGMGSGMGGGRGGMMRGAYGALPGRGWSGPASQSVTISLTVRLPDSVKPAADEFLKEIVRNLGQTLRYAYERYESELADLISQGEHRQESAAEQLAELLGTRSPGRVFGLSQFNTTVDLSELKPEMPFSEAITVLQDSVSPPLPIVVLWKSLLENADVEPSTPIDMHGLPSVKLGTALPLLLRAVSPSTGSVVCEVKEDVIVIEAAATQGEGQEIAGGPRDEVDIQDLAAQRRDLTRNIQAIEMDLASMDARRKAIEEQISRTQNKMAERQDGDEITRELRRIMQTNEELLSRLETQVQSGRLAPSELVRAKEGVMKARIELARRREELAKSAGGEQMSRLSSELSNMAIDGAENKARLEILLNLRDKTQVQLDQASKFDPKAARIRVARQTLDDTERRMGELRRRLADLEPPIVTVIGAN